MERPRTTLSVPTNMQYNQCIPDFYREPICQKKIIPKDPGFPKECKKDTKDPSTFANRYKEICQAMHIQPLNMVKVLLSNISLDITFDRIKLPDIIAILKTIQEDRSLHYVSIKSKLKGFAVQEEIDTEKKAKDVDKALYTRYVVNRTAESLKECVMLSDNLKALKVQGIPFGGSSMEILSQGLKKTENLQHLSLEQCEIGDLGCLHLCRALRAIPTILTLDLTSCKLTSEGANHIAELMKAQEIARFDQSWKQSLRYRTVNNDEMKGLRRVTLNDNPAIGDKGLKTIIDVLLDDFWIRALDVQNCGITNTGAALVMEMIKTNNEIGVVDLRRNSLINNHYVAAIVRTISEHMTPEKAEYGWLCIPKAKKVTSEHSDSTSSTFNLPWNGGPGVKKAKSVSIMDQMTKQTIIKVKEWSASHENNSYCATAFAPPNEAEAEVSKDEHQKQLDTKENELKIMNTNNILDSPRTDSTECSDDSQMKNVEQNKNTLENKRAEDIEQLFCTFINSPLDEISDSDV